VPSDTPARLEFLSGKIEAAVLARHGFVHSVDCASIALLKFGFPTTEATFSLTVNSPHGGSTFPSLVFLAV